MEKENLDIKKEATYLLEVITGYVKQVTLEQMREHDYRHYNFSEEDETRL